MAEVDPTTRDLLRFVDASPTPDHCAAEASRRLLRAGSRELEVGERWELEPGALHHLVRGGTVVAFRVGHRPAAEAGFRILGAHTDSPNLRVKPNADLTRQGCLQLGVEPYGGLLAYTWLDRDLGLAGRVALHGDDAAEPVETRLLHLDRPLLRIPSLAIHLNREIRDKGLQLDMQQHLAPILGLEAASSDERSEDGAEPGPLRRLLAEELEVEPSRILSWSLSLVDVQPAAVGGREGELLFAPRLDNQAMTHASLEALTRAGETGATQVICLYDHEEIGSGTAVGAAGSLVEETLRRLAEAEGPGATAGGLSRAAARSRQCSADMAHAVHPNWADRHEPQHLPHLNGGPVLKVNAQQRYAGDPWTEGLFEALCREAEVPLQKFVNRSDLACGSTIGPITAARLGVPTVDVGNPMLAMHAVRETAGSRDPARMVAVMERWLSR